MAATAELKKLLSARVERIQPSMTLTVVAEATRLREQGAELADFGAGEPHFPTPEHIKQAGIAAIRANFTKYTPVPGIKELRQAIVRRHAADFGSDYGLQEVMASSGGKQALFNALQVLVDHGDEVILPVPYWVSFKDIIEYAGGRTVLVETDERQDFALTPAMVERALSPRTKAIILNSPNNPSGAVMPPEDLGAILRLAAERGIYVISDECYVYLNYTGKLFSAGAVRPAKEHLVIVGSLSKTYAMTGWRLGYALGPAAIIAAMTKLQSQSTSNAAAFVQKAAVEALNGPQDCVQAMRAEYIRLRQRMIAGLRAIPGLRCTLPQGAFYAYPNVSEFFGRGMNSAAEVAHRLLHQAHVVSVPGEGFGTRQHIRLSYATAEQEIDRGLERMRKFFAGA